MPGLAVYAMGSPFKRLPRLEFVYGAASAEALDPLAALLDPNVYDNRGLVLVPDVYSVWPQVGAFPRSQSYREVLDRLQDYMVRRCGLRLGTVACARASYATVPWRGLMGGWRFTGLPGDAHAAVLSALLAAALRERRRPGTVYVVLGEEGHGALQAVVLEAAAATAALLGARLEAVAAEPRPFPAETRQVVELHAYSSTGWSGCLLHTLSLAPEEPLPWRLLEPRTPRGRPPPPSREELLTLQSLVMARRRWLVALVYSGCGAWDPASKLHGIISRALEAYIDATQLSKRKVGGTVAHHLGFNHGMVRALAAAAAAEAAALRSLGGPAACEQVYRRGVPREALKRLEALLGPDATPSECLEEAQHGPKLRDGCMKRLRAEAAEQAGLPAP
ncbi:hypothetical protein CF15_02735 [Pyrodictium occultum]|uniref:Uncharacterized protein n=1 Tax=Pyrodictium occultum TaxID=2309 RepID=A0A0V8RUQ2_PYROC|nr:hypothetical protein [Pyrodictium occultum]KSW11747.1 hypothetical protein CF15_02735 [Pyrodictium occultum]